MELEAGVEIRYASGQEIVAVHGPVVIRIVDGLEVTVEHYERLKKVFEDLLGLLPAAGLLMVIHHDTPSPPLTVRRYAAQQIDLLGRQVSVVVVLEGMGFWSTSRRLAAHGVASLLNQASFALERSVEAGIQAMALDLVGVDPDQLQRIYTQLWMHMLTLRGGAGGQHEPDSLGPS
ncbi:hypothetical protein G6O69_11340 [Pseudenhygromyxa sp. WMMC2535]|uniref:hypothetical protein n=1 Tax=Pseudenhygromyxa sp. WMMC2535 TaxID=2712867 RepID=UPI0015571A4F|nr:hypothetical protein [Pseudenhygromyxa sp. WMMC2535]NVB38426.1 hypothetical protein [Pseudenhygromyxa sp. WMMC2535]